VGVLDDEWTAYRSWAPRYIPSCWWGPCCSLLNHSGHATKILFPQHVRHLAILLMPFDFPTPNTFKSFGFPIFWIWTYLVKASYLLFVFAHGAWCPTRHDHKNNMVGVLDDEWTAYRSWAPRYIPSCWWGPWANTNNK
jgi:hypothetical protein